MTVVDLQTWRAFGSHFMRRVENDARRNINIINLQRSEQLNVRINRFVCSI